VYWSHASGLHNKSAAALAGGDEEQIVIGNFRSASAKSTKNVLWMIVHGLHSRASIELDPEPRVSLNLGLLSRINRMSVSGTEVSSVIVHPVALFSILDHYLRRKDEQARVIGTLLGTVSDSGEVEVCSSFAVPHSESKQQVGIDEDRHHTMCKLHHRINSKEVVVGWYVKLLRTTLFLFLF
jgi:hypothetical protein